MKTIINTWGWRKGLRLWWRLTKVRLGVSLFIVFISLFLMGHITPPPDALPVSPTPPDNCLVGPEGQMKCYIRLVPIFKGVKENGSGNGGRSGGSVVDNDNNSSGV